MSHKYETEKTTHAVNSFDDTFGTIILTVWLVVPYHFLLVCNPESCVGLYL
jgi:hypothetical protein